MAGRSDIAVAFIGKIEILSPYVVKAGPGFPFGILYEWTVFLVVVRIGIDCDPVSSC